MGRQKERKESRERNDTEIGVEFVVMFAQVVE